MTSALFGHRKYDDDDAFYVVSYADRTTYALAVYPVDPNGSEGLGRVLAGRFSPRPSPDLSFRVAGALSGSLKGVFLGQL